MEYPAASERDIKRAHTPHNLYISGIFFFNLLMTPAMIVLDIGMAGLLVPLFCSAAMLVYIHQRGQSEPNWFVQMHWQLCWTRGRLLLIGYAISATLVCLAWLISLYAQDANMKHILWTALTRIALMPTLIFVMVTAVLEFSAIGQANAREVPDKLAARFPPPA